MDSGSQSWTVCKNYTACGDSPMHVSFISLPDNALFFKLTIDTAGGALKGIFF
jgi:hypothetical protein